MYIPSAIQGTNIPTSFSPKPKSGRDLKNIVTKNEKIKFAMKNLGFEEVECAAQN